MRSWSSEHSSTEMICPRSFQVVAYFSAESKAGISPAKAVPVRTIRVVVQC